MKTIPLSILAVLVLAVGGGPTFAQATAPRIHTITHPVDLTLETYQLENGLRVILSRDTSVPVVAVNLWYHVGSANEEPGRSGFAHLFEHLMFQGSQHLDDDAHIQLIEEAGGDVNGTTSFDRTNYFQVVPSNFLERVLWMESDRMGFLLPALTEEKLENQRSVVQNERRQNYENAPYGLSSETIAAALFPPGHPYATIPIGSMEDLNAADMEDVRAFFRRYYAPNNASLAVVGDFEPEQAKRWIQRYFGGIPAGPPVNRPAPDPVTLQAEKRVTLEDRVQLPRLTIAWPTPPFFQPGDAEMDVIGSVLAGGRSSRLYQRLVMEEQIAQSVSAGQGSRPLGSQFSIVVTARPGVDLTRVLEIVDEEIARLQQRPPTEREMGAARNSFESSYIQSVQTALSRADQLNMYLTYTGDPAFLERDFARYGAVTTSGVQEAARRYLGPGRVVLSVVPEGQTQLQASVTSNSSDLANR